jgi:hypothetical protein
MKLFTANMVLLLALSAVGCGSGAKGPAKPEDTPVMTQEQVQEAYKKSMDNMPPDVKKKYGQFYNKK